MIDFIKDIPREFRAFIERVRRMVFWGWAMRNSWDFDAETIFPMLHKKLVRMEHLFINHGHCDWNQSETPEDYPEGVKVMRILIRLADRLANRDAYSYILGLNEKHDDKWGELEWSFEGTPGKNTSRVLFLRKNAISEESKKQEAKEGIEIRKRQYETRERDKKLFFKLLTEHIDKLWD